MIFQISTARDLARYTPDLAATLNACVLQGASIGFVLPHSVDDSRTFWSETVGPGVLRGSRLLLVAQADDRVAGSVQLLTETFPNQRHRADVAKLLVHPDFRRRGIGKALMTELQHHAARLGRHLLTLDTLSGSPAEALYLSLGFVKAGEIPKYARNVFDETLEATTLMYKMLADES